ncbi:MAG: tRNA uridine-5-carboxymethylaminomethyl(34) synthesis enzyme MnmG, partial [Ktedonobacterales bacterium]|nr:tRNA uridine-5-carboxymethylaminomethyl(34) synthesis enzyme MnmG [Ktedonobacterales bacterium]
AEQALLLVDEAAIAEVETRIKFAGYIERQERSVARTAKLESLSLPFDLDYASIVGLRTQAKLQLGKIRPLTLGQAGRIEGVTPSDIAVLLIWLRRAAHQRANTPVAESGA